MGPLGFVVLICSDMYWFSSFWSCETCSTGTPINIGVLAFWGSMGSSQFLFMRVLLVLALKFDRPLNMGLYINCVLRAVSLRINTVIICELCFRQFRSISYRSGTSSHTAGVSIWVKSLGLLVGTSKQQQLAVRRCALAIYSIGDYRRVPLKNWCFPAETMTVLADLHAFRICGFTDMF